MNPLQSPPSVVRMAVIFYVPMIASGWFIRPPGVLGGGEWRLLGWGLLASLALSGVVIAFSRVAARKSAWGRSLHDEFRTVLGPLDSGRILALALLSGFGEEVLFRGVLLPRMGIFLSALLFAALHFPFKRSLIPWTGFALVLGLVLGGLTEYFQSLWPAIVLHFAINFFNLHDLASDLPRAGHGKDTG